MALFLALVQTTVQDLPTLSTAAQWVHDLSCLWVWVRFKGSAAAVLELIASTVASLDRSDGTARRTRTRMADEVAGVGAVGRLSGLHAELSTRMWQIVALGLEVHLLLLATEAARRRRTLAFITTGRAVPLDLIVRERVWSSSRRGR